MKIYDCFIFYNELDLLELRLTELYNYVDHFVLVEANQTHQGKPKPFIFDENKERFSKFIDKIIHIQITDMPGTTDARYEEAYQRNQILRGLDDANDDDLILLTDVDEIIRPEALELMKASNSSIFAMRMTLHNFKFNYARITPGEYDIWGMAVRRSVFREIEPETLRLLRFEFNGVPYQFKNDGCEVVEHAGWHFGYMGDNEWLKDKAQSFSHTEVNTPEFINNIDVEKSIANRQHWGNFGPERYAIVELNDYFPKSLIANLDKYKDNILDNPEANLYNILPPFPYK